MIEKANRKTRNLSHSDNAVKWIDSSLRTFGVTDYRFCIENDCYVCDKDGNFYSVCRRCNHRSVKDEIKFIEQYRIKKLEGSIDRYGYVTYRITLENGRKHLKGHRLMLNAWVGDFPNLVVNHKDGNKKNNKLSNLEWCTVAENNAHAIRTGLFDPHVKKNIKYRIPKCDWLSIYVLFKHCGYSLSHLARINSCSRETIKNLVSRVNKIMPGEVLNGK